MSAPSPRTSPTTRRSPSTRSVVLVGLGVCALLAGVVSFYASGHPDGLEHVAQQLGFGGTAQPHAADDSPLAGYAVQGVADGRLSGGLAGLIGITLVAALSFGLMRLLRRRPETTTEPTTSDRGR